MGYSSVKTKPQRTRNKVFREERDRRRAEAKVRQELATKRSPEDQLARLDAGNKGNGFKPFVAEYERAKLHASITARKAAVAEQPKKARKS